MAIHLDYRDAIVDLDNVEVDNMSIQRLNYSCLSGFQPENHVNKPYWDKLQIYGFGWVDDTYGNEFNNDDSFIIRVGSPSTTLYGVGYLNIRNFYNRLYSEIA